MEDSDGSPAATGFFARFGPRLRAIGGLTRHQRVSTFDLKPSGVAVELATGRANRKEMLLHVYAEPVEGLSVPYLPDALGFEIPHGQVIEDMAGRHLAPGRHVGHRPGRYAVALVILHLMPSCLKVQGQVLLGPGVGEQEKEDPLL